MELKGDPPRIPTELRKRLTPFDRDREILPWQKARSLTRCHLYWLPTDYPFRMQQRRWVLEFGEYFSGYALRNLGLHSQTFLQLKTVYPDLMDRFIKSSREFNPMFGLSRSPSGGIPEVPDMKYVEDLQKGRKAFKFGDKMADYCYWFVGRQEKQQREMFAGYGGLTTIFVKADPETVAPKMEVPPGVRRSPYFKTVFEQWDPDQGPQIAYALKGKFLKKSKELFGAGLEDHAQYPGLLYVLPLLCTKDFFNAPPAIIEGCFETCDVYLNESPADAGMLLASKEDCDDHLARISAVMKDKGIIYPE